MGFLERIGRDGRVIGLDKDPQAVAAGNQLAAGDSRLVVYQGSFTSLRRHMEAQGLLGRVDGVLFDLGVSSPQLDAPERGFSFRQDGPLDMRMDPTSGISAADWLRDAAAEEIARVLKTFGEERYAWRIAKAIVRARGERPLVTTRVLADVVSAASPSRERDKHPATRTFQAIRIFLNRELEEIQEALDQVLDVLVTGGRLAVISFHSLEDRVVKRFMRRHARGDEYPRDLPVPASALRPRLKTIGKPLRPSAVEVEMNPRARSATLRVAEKLC